MLRVAAYTILFSLTIVAVSSCSKKDNTITTTPSYGKWSLGTKEYTAKSSLRFVDWGGKTLKASAENSANTIVFGFKDFPTTSGQYEIVDPLSITAGSKQLSVSIYTQESGTQSYYVSRSDGTFADIVVNNDKVNVSIPIFVTERSTDSTDIVTATVSNIQEQ